MEQDTKVTHYEVKRSKNGFDIPVINGVHLHSAYNPQKEAIHFYEKYQDQISQDSPILILGLGFGYHIEALFEYLENKQKTENIWVLEPSIETVEKYKKINPEIFDKFRLICEDDVSRIYENPEVITFLTRRPTIIPHTPTFNLFSDYYKKFMGHQASQNILDYAHKIKNEKVRDQLNQSGAQDFSEVMTEIRSRKNPELTQEDFFLLTFQSMVEAEATK